MLHINDSRTNGNAVALKDIKENGFFTIGGVGVYRRLDLCTICDFWIFTPKSSDRYDDLFAVDMESGEMVAISRDMLVEPIRDNQLWLEVED